MARALKARPFPSLERLTAEPGAQIPRIQAAPAAPGSVDIAALARQGAALNNAAANAGSALRIFITLDMPRGSLQRLVDQAARSGATLVLRGLKAQSMRQTLAAVSALIETRTVAWVIDPEAFSRFHVTAAPTFVLTLAEAAAPGAALAPSAGQTQCSGGCNALTPPSSYLSVAGDVSLDYALETLLRRAPGAAIPASALLERLHNS
jgi:conjugal transfer pilus assembly protein TrbC